MNYWLRYHCLLLSVLLPFNLSHKTRDSVATNLLMYRNPEDHLIDYPQNEMVPIWAKNVDTRNMRYSNFSLGETGTKVNEFQPKATVSYSSKPAKYLAINGPLEEEISGALALLILRIVISKDHLPPSMKKFVEISVSGAVCQTVPS